LNGITRRIPRARIQLSKMSATARSGEYRQNRPVLREIWPIAAIGGANEKETYL
jgi:hypothetical protein